jgi:hypothetical protein
MAVRHRQVMGNPHNGLHPAARWTASISGSKPFQRSKHLSLQQLIIQGLRRLQHQHLGRLPVPLRASSAGSPIESTAIIPNKRCALPLPFTGSSHVRWLYNGATQNRCHKTTGSAEFCRTYASRSASSSQPSGGVHAPTTLSIRRPIRFHCGNKANRHLQQIACRSQNRLK